MKALIVINRIIEGNVETLGHGTLFVNDSPLLDFCTLERPNLHNKISVSSIPAGTYKGSKIRRGSNNKLAILLHGTEPRTEVLIHSGNFYDDTQGCILLGNRLADADNNGVIDVLNSNHTVNKMIGLIPDSSEIEIQIKKAFV